MRALFILPAILICGCVTPNFESALATYVAEQSVPDSDETVFAFRVDIHEKDQPEPRARYRLSPIPVGKSSTIPPQIPLPPTSKFEMMVRPVDSNKATITDVFCEYKVVVRLYRPGYRTIEIKPGEEARGWQWIPADISEQESAIDALFGIRHDGPKDTGWWETMALAPKTELLNSSSWSTVPFTLGDFGLQPGSVSESHRDSLVFAASEYARLAEFCTKNGAYLQDTFERLKRKSRQLTRYSNEKAAEEYYAEPPPNLAPFPIAGK